MAGKKKPKRDLIRRSNEDPKGDLQRGKKKIKGGRKRNRCCRRERGRKWGRSKHDTPNRREKEVGEGRGKTRKKKKRERTLQERQEGSKNFERKALPGREGKAKRSGYKRARRRKKLSHRSGLAEDEGTIGWDSMRDGTFSSKETYRKNKRREERKNSESKRTSDGGKILYSWGGNKN